MILPMHIVYKLNIKYTTHHTQIHIENRCKCVLRWGKDSVNCKWVPIDIDNKIMFILILFIMLRMLATIKMPIRAYHRPVMANCVLAWCRCHRKPTQSSTFWPPSPKLVNKLCIPTIIIMNNFHNIYIFTSIIILRWRMIYRINVYICNFCINISMTIQFTYI